MKKIIKFLWNWILFIALPIPYLKVTTRGVMGGEWNTWFLSGQKSARREYDRSVSQMSFIWTGLFSTMLLSVGLHIACSDYSGRYLLDIVLSVIVIMWMVLLTPQIQLSYETWNWATASSFTNNLGEAGVHKHAFQKLAHNFLVMKMREYSDLDDFEEFNHLEHIFRVLDLWKGQRKDLGERTIMD